MADRYLKSHVESAFRALCSALGKRVATRYGDVGAWQLDHQPTYGGWNIEEILSEGGAINHPLSDARYKNEIMHHLLWFGTECIRIYERDRIERAITYYTGSRDDYTKRADEACAEENFGMAYHWRMLAEQNQAQITALKQVMGREN